jgi:16S rRNA (uracil1498-N3)-methyltransferase
MSTANDANYMSDKRLYTQESLSTGKRVSLPEDRARYIGRALRLRPKDELILFDGSGGEYSASIVSISKSAVELEVTAHRDAGVESLLDIHLLQGVSRSERMDFVIQKATELGVKRITPVFTEYGVVKLDDRRALKKTEHWNGVAISACEQCGRTRLPKISNPGPLRNWMDENREPAGRRLIMKPGATRPLSEIEIGNRPVTVLIGPEGGFSEAEYELADITGFEPVGFGPRTLRTETAAIAIVAALQTLYGDCG